MWTDISYSLYPSGTVLGHKLFNKHWIRILHPKLHPKIPVLLGFLYGHLFVPGQHIRSLTFSLCQNSPYFLVCPRYQVLWDPLWYFVLLLQPINPYRHDWNWLAEFQKTVTWLLQLNLLLGLCSFSQVPALPCTLFRKSVLFYLIQKVRPRRKSCFPPEGLEDLHLFISPTGSSCLLAANGPYKWQLICSLFWKNQNFTSTQWISFWAYLFY